MSKTTSMESTYLFGLIEDGYVANDHNGHRGYGSTPEDANDALERAQEHDFEYSEKASITGWYHDEEKE
jgi:hypothetical protein